MEKELSDDDLQQLLKKLVGEVKEKEARVQTLRTEVEGVQAQIQRQKKARSDFTVQKLFSAEEISPLVEECLQVRENLKRKKEEFEAVSQGTSSGCKELKELERKLCEVEAKSDLRNLEALNKENLGSISELEREHEMKVKESQELRDQLAELQGRVAELRGRQQAEKERTDSSVSHRGRSMEMQLDMFIRKTCKEAGLNLHS